MPRHSVANKAHRQTSDTVPGSRANVNGPAFGPGILGLVWRSFRPDSAGNLKSPAGSFKVFGALSAQPSVGTVPGYFGPGLAQLSPQQIRFDIGDFPDP